MSQQIRKRSLKNLAVDGDKLRLEQNQVVRAMSSSNSEVSLIRLGSGDKVEVFNPQMSAPAEVAFKSQVEQALLDAEAYTDQKITDLVNGAPLILDTLKEIADALGNDGDFATTILNRISNVESSLSQAIVNEASRAQASEQSLSSALSKEIQDRKDGDLEEKSRAQIAESSLAQSVMNEASRAQASEMSLSNAVSAEASRAQASEQSLSDAIVAEASFARASEQSISNAVVAEASRAQASEFSLSQSLDNLDGYAQDIRSDLDDEISRAGAAESSLSSALAQEKLDRIAGDDAERSRAMGVESSIATSVSTEKQRAELAEQSLSMALAQEKQDRIDAVTTEENRAQDAENSLAQSILNEKSRAVSVEQSLANSISSVNSALSDEQSRAMAAEASLSASIDFIKSNIDPAAIDSLTEIIDAFQSMDGSLQSAIDYLSTQAASALGQEISRAQAAESSLAQSVQTEKQRAMDAEQSLSMALAQEKQDRIDAVTTEENRAQDAELSLAQSILDEKSRAMGVENSISQALTQAVSNLSSEMSAAVAAEASMARAAEQQLSQDLIAEISRSTAIDVDFESRIHQLEIQTDGPVFFKEKQVIMDASSFSSMTLSNSPVANSVCVQLGRLMLIEGEDYSISGNVVTLMGDVVFGGVEGIENGDVIICSYAKDV